MNLFDFFQNKNLIDKKIENDISKIEEKSLLREACFYALSNGGKRIRPVIVLMIANTLGNNLPVISAALAVEYFHTASLIADDLPCMDNEKMRRKNPATHRVFGESVAILASYSLIAKAYEKIGENAEELKKRGYTKSEEVFLRSIKVISECAGLRGATHGQLLDLFPPDFSIETVMKIIHQKTVTLFEVAFSLGWLFGGGDIEKLEKVKKCSHFFGRAFQIADDIEDIQKDSQKEKKINIAHLLGREKAKEILQENIQNCKNLLKEISLYNISFEKAFSFFEKKKAKLFTELL